MIMGMGIWSHRVTFRPIFCSKHLEPSNEHEVTRPTNPTAIMLAGHNGMFIKRFGSRIQLKMAYLLLAAGTTGDKSRRQTAARIL